MSRTPSAETFDPSTVPPYPVLTLTGADNPDNVTLDGQAFTGEDAYDQALSKCVERASELGGSVRVRGVDKDGKEWPLVVTSNGEMHDLSTPATNRKKRQGSKSTSDAPATSRRTFLAAAIVGAGALTVLGGGLAGGYALYRAKQPSAPPPPPKYPGKGALLPVLPPAGVSDSAQWAVKIDKSFTPRLLPNSRVAFMTPEKALIVVDANTGQVQWTASGITRLDDKGALLPLTINTVPMLGLAAGRGLTVWRMDKNAVDSSQQLEVAYGTADVFPYSEAPLWALGTQSAQFLAGDTFATVDIPVPARVAGVLDGNAVAVDKGAWLSITPDNSPTTHALENTPDGTLVDACLIGTTLLSAWETDDNYTVAAHRLPGGYLIASETLKGRVPNNADPLVSPSHSMAAWAGALIREDSLTPLANLQTSKQVHAAFKPEVITDHTLYGSLDSTPTRVNLSSLAVSAEAEDVALPLFMNQDETLAYIVANKLEDTVLHALPARHVPAASDGGGEASDGGGEASDAGGAR